MATGTLSEAAQQRLQTLYAQTNPQALRQRIYDQLAALRALPGWAPTVETPAPELLPATTSVTTSVA